MLLLLGACGVKGDPTSPSTPKLPSLMENYPDTTIEKPLDENKPQ